MRVTVPYDISNLTINDPLLISNLAQCINTMVSIINGNVSFKDNISCRLITCIFTSANQTQAFPHSLDRVPTGYIVIGMSSASTVYSGNLPNSPNVIYLQSTAVNSVNLLIF